MSDERASAKRTGASASGAGMTTGTAHACQSAHLAGEPASLNILVLDDSFDDFDAMRRALSRMEGFKATVTRARTLQEARLARSREEFDVVFVDFNLGTESGARFLDELGGRCGSAIPILVTGLLDHRVHEIALNAGALGIVNKCDITPRLLEAQIRSALHTQRVERQLHGIISAISSKPTA